MSSGSNASDNSAVEVVQLVAKDGEKIPIEKGVIEVQSVIIRNLFENSGGETTDIPLDFTASAVRAVVAWCQQHVDIAVPLTEDELSHDRFIRELTLEEHALLNMDPSDLAEVLKAAHYLEVTTLLNAACRMAAKQIEAIGTIEGIKQYLNFPEPI